MFNLLVYLVIPALLVYLMFAYVIIPSVNRPCSFDNYATGTEKDEFVSCAPNFERVNGKC